MIFCGIIGLVRITALKKFHFKSFIMGEEHGL